MNEARRLGLTLIVLLSTVARADPPLIGCDGALAEAFGRPPAPINGNVAWGPRPTAKTLRAAYLNGIYPMDPFPAGTVGWFSPPRRGVLFFDEMRVPRSDAKAIRRVSARCRVVFDKRSHEVIAKCRRPRVARAGDWITKRLIDGYRQAFDQNLAHSVATLDGDRLTGGLFGIYAGYFSGDSMFHDEDDAAKVAFLALIDFLKDRGHTFIDVQQAFAGRADGKRSLAVKWGAREIPREDFLNLIRRTQDQNLPFDPPSPL